MRIRSIGLLSLAAALLVAATIAIVAWLARTDGGTLDGTWKLVTLALGDDDMALFELTVRDGRTLATLVDAQQQLLGQPQVKDVDQKGDEIKISLSGPAGETTFDGRLAEAGPSAGMFLGSYNFHGETLPARLEKTTNTNVAPLQQNPLIDKCLGAINEPNPRKKIDRLEEAINECHGAPSSQLPYRAILEAAEAAGLDAQKVGDLIKQWGEEAKPYGDAWFDEVQFKALMAVGRSKSFAKLSLALAQEVDKTISDGAIAKKAAVAAILAHAARLAGEADLAKEADARHAKLEGQLDEKYLELVPPFKTTPYGGRKNPRADRVVLMEIFTGAQCPPCVAADVAFDALLQTYKPADFIGLQYHLHVPGPDPLTVSDSMTRQKYYSDKVQGTPATLFNGQIGGEGGGGLEASQQKYTEYRQLIDKTLEMSKGAQIDLSVTRTGDQIKIVASAAVTGNAGDQKGDGFQSKSNGQESEKAKDGEAKTGRFLRLALTEASIRYIGSNKLRLHHRVVRAFPGGVTGRELAGGAAKVEVVLDLAELKRGLERSVSDFAKMTQTSAPLPEIKLDQLAVVAFVQDDGDQSILHAVSVPVKPANP